MKSHMLSAPKTFKLDDELWLKNGERNVQMRYNFIQIFETILKSKVLRVVSNHTAVFCNVILWSVANR